MKVKVIRPFSTYDATGKIAGVKGDVLKLHRSTALRLINQGFAIDHEKPVKKQAKVDKDQEK